MKPFPARKLARRLAGLLALVFAAGWICGCATDDQNLSERPWNSPKSWETGLPSALTEERR